MHELQTIAISVPACLSVCLSRGFTRLWCAKTGKRIEVLSPHGIVHLMQPLPNYFGHLFLQLFTYSRMLLFFSVVRVVPQHLIIITVYSNSIMYVLL